MSRLSELLKTKKKTNNARNKRTTIINAKILPGVASVRRGIIQSSAVCPAVRGAMRGGAGVVGILTEQQ